MSFLTFTILNSDIFPSYFDVGTSSENTNGNSLRYIFHGILMYHMLFFFHLLLLFDHFKNLIFFKKFQNSKYMYKVNFSENLTF